jgi:hypothetical protein
VGLYERHFGILIADDLTGVPFSFFEMRRARFTAGFSSAFALLRCGQEKTKSMAIQSIHPATGEVARSFEEMSCVEVGRIVREADANCRRSASVSS